MKIKHNITREGYKLSVEKATVKMEWVYVSDMGETDALKFKRKRILITKLPWTTFNPCICVSACYEDKYITWELYGIEAWKYAVPAQTDEKKLREIWMTDAEMEKFNSIIK